MIGRDGADNRAVETSRRKAPRILSPLTGLRLLLPAIVPSWRFFDAVTASPRVDYALLTASDAVAGDWQEFRPRPAHLGAPTMLRRLLWNPTWNENLFLVSLAERLMRGESAESVAHSERELLLRVARHLDRHGPCDPGAHLQIRLRFIGRFGADEPVSSEIVYLSAPQPIAGLLTP